MDYYLAVALWLVFIGHALPFGAVILGFAGQTNGYLVISIFGVQLYTPFCWLLVAVIMLWTHFHNRCGQNVASNLPTAGQ